MNIQNTGLSKGALKSLSIADSFIRSYQLAKNGRSPERVKLLSKDYRALYTSATKDMKDKPKELMRHGVVIYG